MSAGSVSTGASGRITRNAAAPRLPRGARSNQVERHGALAVITPVGFDVWSSSDDRCGEQLHDVSTLSRFASVDHTLDGGASMQTVFMRVII